MEKKDKIRKLEKEREKTRKPKIHFEEERRLILDSVFELITFQDTDLKIVWANKAAGDSLGMKPESLIGKHCYELWHGRGKVCDNCPVHRAIQTGENQEGEIKSPDGRIWFIRGYPVKGKDGKILGAIEVTSEITERKKMEEALRRRSNILLTISSLSNLFLIGEDFEKSCLLMLEGLGRAVEASRAYIFENHRDESGRLLTSQRYEWVAEGIEPQINNPDLQNFPWMEMGFERQVKIFESNNPVYGLVRDFPEQERKVLEPQGIISLLTVPIFVDNEWWGFIGFDDCLMEREWTEAEIDALKLAASVIGSAIKRKKIEEALQESEKKFRLIAERAHDLIYRYEFHPKRGFTYVSPSSTLLTGYTPEEHYSDPDLGFKIVHPDDIPILEKIAKGEEGFEKPVVLRWIKKDGNIVWTEQINTPIYDEEGRLIAIEGVARDITEKKKAEENLKLQMKYFEGLFETSPFAIVLTDKEGKVMRTNREFERMFGWKEDEIKGLFIDDIVIEPERKEEAFSLTKKVLEGDIVYSEGERIRKDGRKILVSIIAHPIIIDGEYIAQIGIYTDITEKKKMEEALIESEERFRSLTEKSLVGIYLFQDGIFVYVNPKFEEIFGYSKEELIGKMGPKDLTHPDDWWIVEENVRKRLKGEAKDVHYEFRGIRKDKKVIYVEVHGSLIVYKGKPAIIGTLQDITERKLADEALRKSEEKYRSLFEESKDGIFISTPEGKIIDVNPAMVEIYGYSSREELMEIPIEDLYLDPMQREEYKKKLEKEGFVKNYEIRGRKKDGTPITLLETSTAVRDEKGNVIAYRGIIRDVTAQKKMEEQLIQSVKMEAIGRLAGGIAHDFNNILTVISGNAELLLPKFPPDSPEYKRIQQIIESSKRATELTKQLMTVSKRGIAEPVVLNFNDVIKDMEEMLKRLIGEDIKFELQLNPGLKNVKADRTQIEQIIMNMVVNARDAMPKGGELKIKTENVFLDEEYCKIYPGLKEGEYVLILISDTGVGIPPEIIQNIFEPFFTTKKEGTGLGLSTVYWIVKQLGGNVTVYSELRKGTTFKIYIPACEEEIRKEGEILKFEESSRGNETILVVEDEKEIIEYVEDVLTPLGYKIISATSEKEILEKLKEFKGEIHLLLTDVVLPDKSGPEIAKTLALKIPGIKILFMSGYPEEKLQGSEIIEGKVNFISKPFTPSALARKIREVLDKNKV